MMHASRPSEIIAPFQNQYIERWLQCINSVSLRLETHSTMPRVSDSVSSKSSTTSSRTRDPAIATRNATKRNTDSSIQHDYLRLPVEIVADPLKWWCDNRHVYPGLARMALDYLSTPG